MKKLILILSLIATPAFAGHTQDAVIYDPVTGVVQMVVYPADDAELADPAFNPPAAVQQRVPHDVDARNPTATSVAATIAEAQARAPSAGILQPVPAALPVQTQPEQPVLEGTDIQVNP